jgi:hypothetical protein
MAFVVTPPDTPPQPTRGLPGLWIGLVIGFVGGAFFGAYMMYVSEVSTLPVAINAVSRGMAVESIEPRSGSPAPTPAP